LDELMSRLFMVLVGGAVDGAHVELHDTRFVIAPTIEDAIPDLRAQWWGRPNSIHLDAWGELEWADGYRIDLAPGPAEESSPRLWFVNLGGYDPTRFDELHANLVVVANDEGEAKRRALAAAPAWTSPHKDRIFAAERMLDIGATTPEWRILLTPDPTPRPFRFEARYVRIGSAS
jgi:hypothetical protein